MTEIQYNTEKLKRSRDTLTTGDAHERMLFEQLRSCEKILEKNPNYGTYINNAIGKHVYALYGLDNLFKIDLRDGWRLLYTKKNDKRDTVVIILGWMNHTAYERLFKY